MGIPSKLIPSPSELKAFSSFLLFFFLHTRHIKNCKIMLILAN